MENLPESLKEISDKISKNADRLISIGFKNWSKGRSGKKSKKDQQDQLRDIEDKIVEDEIGKGS